MATWKPELHNIEAVLNYYDENDFSAYKVFAGSFPKPEYCRFFYDGSDKSIGREKLEQALHSILQNTENTNTYNIQILRQKGKTFEPYNQITFQLNKANQYLPATMGAMNFQQNNVVNNEILSRLRGLEEKLLMLESDEDEDEDEPEEEQNILTGLLNSPQVKNMIIGMLANFMTPKQPQAVAGIPANGEPTEDEKIQTALEILKQKTPDLGDKLLKLAEMSIQNESQYYWLVKML